MPNCFYFVFINDNTTTESSFKIQQNFYSYFSCFKANKLDSVCFLFQRQINLGSDHGFATYNPFGFEKII